MVHRIKDLSPEDVRTVENLLGCSMAEDDFVSIRAIRPSAIVSPRLPMEEREKAIRRLQGCFAKIDAQRKTISDAEEEAIIDEALRSTRPNYRPVG